MRENCYQVGVELMLEADQGEVRKKSMALGSLFVRLINQVILQALSAILQPFCEALCESASCHANN